MTVHMDIHIPNNFVVDIAIHDIEENWEKYKKKYLTPIKKIGDWDGDKGRKKRKEVKPNLKREFRIGDVEDFDQLFNDKSDSEVFSLEPSMISTILSKEQVRIIHEIRKKDYSVGEIGKQLKRNLEHVSRDIHSLESFGLVHIVKESRHSIPKTSEKLCITV